MLHHKRTQMASVANITISPCVIAMVGLPARGKTYMAKKLARYFNWIGIETKVFNVGEYRRRAVTTFTNSDEIFNPNNPETLQMRENCAKMAMGDLVTWLHEEGKVAIYDATNSNRERRKMICDYLSSEHGFRTLFVESICTDAAVIEANIREVKISNPDYKGVDKNIAAEDFKKRIAIYEAQYEPIDDDYDKQLSFIKIFNQGASFVINKIQGHVQSRAAYYLMNIHVLPRTIYITRTGETLVHMRLQAGETEENTEGKICKSGTLSERGCKFAKALGKFVDGLNVSNLRVWTSTEKHGVQTVANIDKMVPREHWKPLSELDAGVAENLTYDEFASQYPEEYFKRHMDKYQYRYPGGESYSDLVARLEPVIMELERQENVMVVCDQAVARSLLGYFNNIDTDELPYLEVPLHTVFKLTPVAYGCKCEQINLGVPAVSTHRSRPKPILPLTLEERRLRRNRTSECREPECCCVPRNHVAQNA